MIVKGLMKYFKDLSVGDTLIGSFLNPRKKISLYYADEEILSTSKSIEIDATTIFNISMQTQVIKTPAENQKVYTAGALKSPKTIEITGYINKTKIEQINELYNNTIPVWVLSQTNFNGVITQIGYYADGNKYLVTDISMVEEGYDNIVAIRLLLEEIVFFTYQRELIYSSKSNSIVNQSKTSKVNGAAVKKVIGYGEGGVASATQNFVDKPNIRGL